MKDRLKEIREKQGLSGAAFAKELGIPQKTYHNYESGKNQVPAEIARKIYERFKVSLIWLLTGEGDMYTTLPTEAKTPEQDEDFKVNPKEKALLLLLRQLPDEEQEEALKEVEMLSHEKSKQARTRLELEELRKTRLEIEELRRKIG